MEISSRLAILAPLGGEDALRLFCGTESFEYGQNRSCQFSIGSEYRVEISYLPYDPVFRKPVWSLCVWDDKGSTVTKSSCITYAPLVKIQFEYYTNHVLDFG